jgi:hypothetical protein
MTYDIHPTLRRQIKEQDPLAFTRSREERYTISEANITSSTGNLAESAMSELTNRAMQELESRFKHELATNDWDRYPILDIVRGQEYNFGLGRTLSIESHPYESPAPRFRDCHYPPNSSVWRVTRPLYDKLLQEHTELFSGEER